MTRPELEIALDKIGWRIEKSHNLLNDFIINHFGQRTNFVVSGHKLDVRKNLFGGDSELGRGAISFNMSDLWITYGGDSPTHIEWVAINFNKNCFIQFYNHTDGR